MAKLAMNKFIRRTGRRSVIVALALLALAASPALGATVTMAPAVSGDASPGSELTASSGAWTPASATPVYDWLRCDDAGAGCAPVAGSCDRHYTVRDADLGHTLRARLTVLEPGQSAASGASDPTPVVVIKPYSVPTPGDSGETCVVVTPTGPDQGTFTSGTQTPPGTNPAPDTALAFIRPFPLVRIAGSFTARRTKLTRVTVNAPRGARIRLDCKGGGCPYKRKTMAARLVRVRALQRSYRPGRRSRSA
jgi:hypothetical protein